VGKLPLSEKEQQQGEAAGGVDTTSSSNSSLQSMSQLHPQAQHLGRLGAMSRVKARADVVVVVAGAGGAMGASQPPPASHVVAPQTRAGGLSPLRWARRLSLSLGVDLNAQSGWFRRRLVQGLVQEAVVSM
jgi:hypothetical protein